MFQTHFNVKIKSPKDPQRHRFAHDHFRFRPHRRRRAVRHVCHGHWVEHVFFQDARRAALTLTLTLTLATLALATLTLAHKRLRIPAVARRPAAPHAGAILRHLALGRPLGTQKTHKTRLSVIMKTSQKHAECSSRLPYRADIG